MIHVHPQEGYLNTEFLITCMSSCEVIVSAKSLEYQDEVSESAKKDITFHIKKGETIPIRLGYAGIYSITNTNDDCKRNIKVKDAIKLGGSTFKSQFVFEKTPWCFTIMKDRTYFYNRLTDESYVELISPDMVKYVNKNIVMFSNNEEKENSLYSLEKHKSIVHFGEYMFLNDEMLIYLENKNGKETIVLVNLKDENFSQTRLEGDLYSIDAEYRSIYLVKGRTISIYSMDTLSQIGSLEYSESYGKIVKFTNTRYVASYIDGKEKEIINIYGIKENKIVGSIESLCPITSFEMIAFANKNKQEVYKEFLRKISNDITNGIIQDVPDLRYKFVSIPYIFVNNGDVRCMQETSIYYINEYGNFRIEDKVELLDCLTNEITLIGQITAKWLFPCRYENNVLICFRDDQYLITNAGLQIIKKPYCVRMGNYGYVITKTDEKNKTEEIFTIQNGTLIGDMKGVFDWNAFEKWGIILEIRNKYLLRLKDNRLRTKCFPQSAPSKLTILSKENVNGQGHNTLMYGKHLICQDDVFYLRYNLVLPELWADISENASFIMGVKGTHVYLYSKKDLKKDLMIPFYENYMSAEELIEKEKSSIVFTNNPDMPSTLRFTCGSKFGYTSRRIAKLYRANVLETKDMDYAEFHEGDYLGDGEWNYVPHLFLKGCHHTVATSGDSNYGYIEKEILIGRYDVSSYGEVMLSDDGKNILFQKDKTIFLMDVMKNEVMEFPSLNFITHVNGYRPIFRVDGSRRRVRIIDPISNTEINNDYIVNYNFISPDQKLYAGTKLADYTKFIDKIRGVEISRKEYMQFKEKYDSPDYSQSEEFYVKQKTAREEFIEVNSEYFNNIKGFEKKEAIQRSIFTNYFLEVKGIARIYATETKEIVAEIELGKELWFLNYVSFSYDSRYVAIAGRYPDNSGYGGLFLVYDLKLRKDMIRCTSVKAVWRTAFTPSGMVASYDSNPNTFIANLNNDVLTNDEDDISENNGFSTIEGKNFLTFSPNGQYLALSCQGYRRYIDEDDIGGHMACTSVYIHSTSEPEKTIVLYNDLADGGVKDEYAGEREKSATSVSFSMDNKKLMVVGNDGTVVIRNLHLKKN